MTRPATGAPYASWIFLILFVLTPLTAYLWPFGLAAFTPIAAILLIPVFRPERPGLVWAALLALLIYALVSVLWSPVFADQGVVSDYADAERQTWAKVVLNLGLYAVLVGVAARLPVRTMRRLAVIFMVGAVLLSAVLAFEGLTGTRLYHLLTTWSGDAMRPDLERRNVAQGTYSLALMYWPAVTLLLRRGWRRAALLLTLGAFSAPLLLGTWAPFVALIGGGVAYWLIRVLKDRASVVIGASFAAVILLAPWVVLLCEGLFDWAGARLGASWAARLDIWSFTAEQTLRHPIFGWGLDGSRAFLPFMLHPHSAPLQIWLELGLVGAVLLAVVWWLLIQRAGRLGPQAVAAAATYFVIGGLSFGMWQEWWLGLAALTAIWCMAANVGVEPNFEPVIEA